MLVPDASPLPSEETEDIRASVAGLELDPGPVVVVSPHGDTTGVYAATEGSLAGFGVPEAAVGRPTDTTIRERVVRAWRRPLLDNDPDHGVIVPLLCGLAADRPVVGVTLREVTGAGAASFDEVIDDAVRLGESLRELLARGEISLVASVNTAAALTPRAPLTERPAARAVERRLLEALGRGLDTADEIAGELWLEGGSCAAGPLVALSHAVPEARAVPLVYDHPYGVGYLVAKVS